MGLIEDNAEAEIEALNIRLNRGRPVDWKPPEPEPRRIPSANYLLLVDELLPFALVVVIPSARHSAWPTVGHTGTATKMSSSTSRAASFGIRSGALSACQPRMTTPCRPRSPELVAAFQVAHRGAQARTDPCGFVPAGAEDRGLRHTPALHIAPEDLPERCREGNEGRAAVASLVGQESAYGMPSLPLSTPVTSKVSVCQHLVFSQDWVGPDV